ncbi:MAG: ATP-dependent helicase [Nitrospirota bacterium]|nr:ATP-dependent helicase [Nitrospirota bacterium]
MFTPTPEQRTVIDTANSAMVIAGPGTGKTRTAIEKAKLYCSRLDAQKRQKVLFLSFSNSAVRRLSEAAAVNFSARDRRHLRFATYHSYAAELLRHYGRFVGLPPKIQIMDTIEQALTLLEMSIDFTADTRDEVLRSLARQGRLGFDVLIPLTIRLLESAPTLRRIATRCYPLVIVDEFQDTSEHQWRLLQLIGADTQVLAFGDPNQIIYSSLHGATVKRFEQFQSWKMIEPHGFSRHNYRCEQTDILGFAEALLSASPFTPPEKSSMQIFRLQYRPQLRSALALIWKAIQEQGGTAPTVGIIVPSNAIADEIAVALRNPPAEAQVKIKVFAKQIADGAAYDAVILAVLALRDYSHTRSQASLRKFAMALHAMDIHWNRRKKMTLKSVNQLEKSLAKILSDGSSSLSALAARLLSIADVREIVPAFVAAIGGVQECEVACRRIASHGKLPLPHVDTGQQLELFDLMRQSRTVRGLEGYEIGAAKTEIITYHRAKGREFDFVLMLVDPRSESSKTPIDELRRLYYVCATRARRWLGLICYQNDIGRVLGPVLSPATNQR